MSDRLGRLLGKADDSDKRQDALAACALLMEVAFADNEHTVAESAIIRRAMIDTFRFDSAMVNEVMAIAQERDHVPGENAKEVRERFSFMKRYHIAEVMRDIIWSDGEVHEDEAEIAVMISSSLGLPLDEVRRILTKQD